MVLNGQGTTVVFGTSGFSAEITNISFQGRSRKALPTSHLGTTDAETFMPGDLVNNGQIVLDINFDPSDSVPMATDPETITVTFPDASSRAGSGFVIDESEAVPLDDVMTQQITIQRTGVWT